MMTLSLTAFESLLHTVTNNNDLSGLRSWVSHTFSNSGYAPATLVFRANVTTSDPTCCKISVRVNGEFLVYRITVRNMKIETPLHIEIKLQSPQSRTEQ